ncbi:MAG: acetyltransferase [Gemmatimonadetes bacterium]|nr:acetyltransferase [Gemmatimonadota bacterium]
MRVIGIGAGGHAKVVMEILRLTGGHELVGLLDAKRELWGTAVMGVPVLGDDSLLCELHGQGLRHAFIGVGTTGDTKTRRRLYEEARRQGFEMVAAVHPRAVIASSARLGAGPTIMAGAVINADTWLGANVIVNTGAIVEHDCVVGDHVHIATGACLAGAVRVGTGAHVGLGASVRQGIRIGENAVVGAGAAVVDDVPDGVVVAGVPARVLRGAEGS